MSCTSCNEVVISEEGLPPLVPPTPNSTPICPDSETSVCSSGCKLDTCLTDPRNLIPDEGMTLLGRVGDRLTRFAGNGYIEIRDSLAYLTASPLIRIRDVWAKWTTSNKIGDPLPFPFSTAVDAEGALHALTGLCDHDSIQVWDKVAAQWSVVRIGDLPQTVSNTLPQSDHIELTGYEEVGMDNASCGQDREMKALRGNGMVYLEKVPVNDCDDPCGTEAFAYVAKVLEFPTIVTTETYKLQFSLTGLAWVQE